MVDTKSRREAVDNWDAAIAGVAGDYERGVEAADNVVDKMIAAEDLWVERVIQAANNRARSKGLEGLSDSEWKRLAVNKGARRIGQGMRQAKDKFSSGINDVLDALGDVDLPDKVADPMANVDNRVKPIVQRMLDLKEERRG